MLPKGLNFAHLNCRILYRKIDQVGLLFADYDFLCCSETWLSSAYPDSLISIPNRNIFRCDRTSRGGGVCIYVKSCLGKYCKIDDMSSYNTPDLEIITVDVTKPGLKFMKVICIYRPPRGDVKRCIDNLTEILSQKDNFKCEFWFLGDINIDYRKRENHNYKQFQTFFKKFALDQLIHDVTRPNSNSGSCIDWIFTNSKFVSNSGVTNIYLSDHYAIECTRKKSRQKNKMVFRDRRNYTNYNRENLIRLMSEKLNSDHFPELDDPNAQWACIYKNLIDLLAIMCPLKRYVQREHVTPWITAQIYSAIRYRDKLINLYKITGGAVYLNLAKRQRNTVNMMIETAKKTYIQNLLDSNVKTPKKFWKNINLLIKGPNTGSKIVTFVDPYSHTEIQPGQEPNFLNDYFNSISERLGIDQTNVHNYNPDYLSIYDNIDNVFDLSNDLPTAEEILSYAIGIDTSKSSSVVGINSQICKDLLLYMPDCFLQIFLTSINTGIFPTDWAKGTITILPKSGTLSDPSNWRPITQTSIFAKIFEKIIYQRTLQYITDNSVLTKYQYGFMKGKSTQHAIFDFTKYVYSNLNHKKLIGGVCLDVAKAFDCLNHDILLYKMQKIGFTDGTIDWFRSYLTRSQVVKYNDNLSTVKNVKTGIGQGTILGPLLFIFYINDVIAVTNSLKINMYADDCILYCSGNDWNRMKLKMQPELDSLQSWFTHNRLKLNTNKSNVLLIGSRSKLSKVDYANTLSIDARPLKFVDKYKYLGTSLDKEMTLSNVLADIKKSVLNKLFILRKLRGQITEKCAITIYKQMILPIFDYVNFLLVACNKSDRHELQVIQNDALRTCFNVRRRDRLSVSNMHIKANLLSLTQRRCVQLLGLMYNHSKNPEHLRVYIRNTREADHIVFRVERYENMKYKNSPYYVGSELWSDLPLDVVHSPTLQQFKLALKKLYKTNKEDQ